MKVCIVVVLLGTLMNGTTSMIHTLMEFWVSSCELPNFPDFVTVGVYNGHKIYQFDSKTRTTVFKQEWMNKLIEEEPRILEWRTHRDMNEELKQKNNLGIFKERLNQTQGLHILQIMRGCEWDDETDEILKVYSQYAFDGEDFISFDWDTKTWVAAKSQAFAIKLSWDRSSIAFHVETEAILCKHYLKKFARFGEKALKRKELPRVSFLQKSSSSPVTCHATGFYPDRAMLFWAKDGEELEEDPGEILPNNDGTFQSSVSLDLSSVPTEDWGRYSCVFQLSGVPDDLITKLDPSKILTNEKKLMPIIVAVSVALAVAAAAAVAGVVLYRKHKSNNVI